MGAGVRRWRTGRKGSEGLPVFDRIVSWSIENPMTPAARYLAATLVIVMIGLARALFITSLLPWLLFIPAVIAITLAFAEGAGIYASILAAIVAAASIGNSTQPLWLTPAQWAGSVLFVIVAIGLAFVAGEVREGLRRTRLLNGELGHRLKNILALVQSVAHQTFRHADMLEAANKAFSSRLAALATATDILTATSWKSATVREVMEVALISVDGLRHRVHLRGPDVKLSSELALAMTLTLHELTTNACKYGALSNDVGTIDVDWTCAGDDVANRHFQFVWQERGGPLVSVPERTGFGSRLIERLMKSYFGGEIITAYDAAGLRFTIDGQIQPSS